MNLELEYKVVVLTGGTGGVGRSIALAFLLEESTVVVLHRNDEKYKKLQTWLKGQVSIDKLMGIKTNILDPNRIQETMKNIAQQYARIDILINCAGYAQEAPFLMLEDEGIDKMLDINLKSPIYLSRAVLRYMMKQRAGSIINISSVSSRKGGRGISVYASAKAGLERFTKVLAQEVGRKNIRVNAVCPGVIDTEMSLPLRERIGGSIIENTALEKYGSPSDVAKAVLFLASEKMASFITGHVLNVDGGFSL